MEKNFDAYKYLCNLCQVESPLHLNHLFDFLGANNLDGLTNKKEIQRPPNDRLAPSFLELSELLTQYIDLYESSPINFIIIDKDYNILSLNKAAAELLKQERSNLQSKNFLNFLSSSSHQKCTDHMEQLIAHGNKQSFEVTITNKFFTYFTLINMTLTSKNKILISLTDISAFRQNEEILRKSNKKLSILNEAFQNTKLPLAILDTDYNIATYNRYFKNLFYRAFNLQLTNETNFINILFSSPDEQDKKILLACQQSLKNKQTSTILGTKNLSNSIFYYILHLCPIINGHNKSISLMLVINIIDKNQFLNIQKLKYAAEINHLEDANSIEDIFSVLSNEIKQPLMAINLYTQSCMTQLTKSNIEITKSLETIQQISHQVNRTNNMLKHIQNSVKEQPLMFEPADINKIVKFCLSTLNYELEKKQVKIETQLAKVLPNLLLDEFQLERALLNLLNNFIHSLNINQEKPYLRITTDIIDGYISIQIIHNKSDSYNEPNEVRDNCFITESAKICPSSTLCKNIIESFGGSINITSDIKNIHTQLTFPIQHNIVIDNER